MGTVAFIEERGHINLGLGMPAGIFTVIAAGVSVHTSRGFGGYSEPSCTPSLRFLGPRLTVALPLTLLWTAACVLQAVIAILSLLQLILGPRGSQLSVLAALLLALSAATLSAVLALLRIDCRYDPD
ncbi:hypothetical protein O3M35_010916 [Rhynocoris fuscipes]|uniref:Uncharacterized protein n=1 Tax=Rhynocoris fuscipes TaxID=488301 RepID=A0AAW1D4E8_9HEMI